MDDKLSEDVLKIFNTLALSNSGSNFLILTDKSINIIMLILALFHNTTQNDINTYIHIQEYTHLNYLHLLRTINVNPPIDMNTYVIKGDIIQQDLGIYDDTFMDCIFVLLDSIVTYASILPLLWTKLKSNGSIIVKGIKHEDKNRLREFQMIFGSLIIVPSTVNIAIHLIEGTCDIVAIKKPCY